MSLIFSEWEMQMKVCFILWAKMESEVASFTFPGISDQIWYDHIFRLQTFLVELVAAFYQIFLLNKPQPACAFATAIGYFKYTRVCKTFWIFFVTFYHFQMLAAYGRQNNLNYLLLKITSNDRKVYKDRRFQKILEISWKNIFNKIFLK